MYEENKKRVSLKPKTSALRKARVNTYCCLLLSWVQKIPWRRAGQPTPVFLPGESHGQRSLVGYSPQGPKDPVTTEHLSANASV